MPDEPEAKRQRTEFVLQAEDLFLQQYSGPSMVRPWLLSHHETVKYDHQSNSNAHTELLQNSIVLWCCYLLTVRSGGGLA